MEAKIYKKREREEKKKAPGSWQKSAGVKRAAARGRGHPHRPRKSLISGRWRPFGRLAIFQTAAFRVEKDARAPQLADWVTGHLVEVPKCTQMVRPVKWVITNNNPTKKKKNKNKNKRRRRQSNRNSTGGDSRITHSYKNKRTRQIKEKGQLR